MLITLIGMLQISAWYMGFWLVTQVWFSTRTAQDFLPWKIDQQVYNTFRACRDWATVHTWNWTVSSQHFYTSAPHTAGDKKLGRAWKWVGCQDFQS